MHATLARLVTWGIVNGGCRFVDLQMAIQYRTNVQVDLVTRNDSLRIELVIEKSLDAGYEICISIVVPNCCSIPR